MVLIGLIINRRCPPGARGAGEPVQAAGADASRRAGPWERPDTGAVTS
jgi:hypothetical protein